MATPAPPPPGKLAQNVARCERGPVTRDWLARDLAALGVRPGMLLMVHTSLSALGFMAGGPETVLQALRDAVGAMGTLVLPAFHWQNSEPAHWTNPPVPESWWHVVRDETLAYDEESSPIDPELGHIPLLFKQLPGTLRSAHPSVSWCAQGPLAATVTAGHELAWGLDDRSPLGRCYDRDAWVLSLGCKRTTILHLAESRSDWAGRHLRMSGSRLLVDGVSRWVEYETVDDTDKDFEQCRLDYLAEAEGADVAEGPTGYGTSRLLRVRPLVDFATAWFNTQRLD
jgi:aminoglycoside 3-N-acetyltransferase